MSGINVQHFYDPGTNTLTYAVWDPSSGDAVVIDPLLDYNHHSGEYHTASADKLAEWAKGQKLKVHYILETHAHADHLTGAQVLKKHFPQARVGIGERIKEVRRTFCKFFGISEGLHGGETFDKLIKADEELKAGTLSIRAIPTPGHTPACMSYLIGDALFTGDALFMPDYGTGRCDFPAGNAEDLYDSIQRLYQLPESTRVFTGHDYQPGGRELKFLSSIGQQKAQNTRLKSDTPKGEFVAFRKARDATLDAPKLLLPSIQVNIFAGHLPPDGVLRLPLTLRSSGPR